MRRAIQLSSNIYFYSLANEMGVDLIHDFMKPMGFGQITGIDLGGELRGVLPSTAWKRAAYKRPEQQKWYAGETISLGIGQGYNNFTMLQLAQATAIFGSLAGAKPMKSAWSRWCSSRARALYLVFCACVTACAVPVLPAAW